MIEEEAAGSRSCTCRCIPGDTGRLLMLLSHGGPTPFLSLSWALLGLAAPVSSLHLVLHGTAQLVDPWLGAHCSQAPTFHCTPCLSMASWPSTAPSTTRIRQQPADSKRVPKLGVPSSRGLAARAAPDGTGTTVLALGPAAQLPFRSDLDSAHIEG